MRKFSGSSALLILVAFAFHAAPAQAVHRFGTKIYTDPQGPPLISPLDAVRVAASRTYTSALVSNTCQDAVPPVASTKLSINKLRALSMAVTWYEGSGARSTNETPNPMTHGRNDPKGPTSTPPGGPNDGGKVEYWHPGIGMWQLDDRGIGSPYGQARFSAYSAGIVTKDIATKWCSSKATTEAGKLTAAFSSFFACDLKASQQTTGEFPKERKCDRAYREIYDSMIDALRDITPTPGTDSAGGSDFYRRCLIGPRGANEKRADCTYVDIPNAQESRVWLSNTNVKNPLLASPYYVMRQVSGGQGYEVRVWIVSKTRQVMATRKYGTDSRTSTVWRTVNFCDLTTNVPTGC